MPKTITKWSLNLDQYTKPRATYQMKNVKVKTNLTNNFQNLWTND